MKEIVEGLLEAPSNEIDDNVRESIKQWSNPPKAIEILETLDMIVWGASASDFVLGIVEYLFNSTLVSECVTYDELIPKATWRNNIE